MIVIIAPCAADPARLHSYPGGKTVAVPCCRSAAWPDGKRHAANPSAIPHRHLRLGRHDCLRLAHRCHRVTGKRCVCTRRLAAAPSHLTTTSPLPVPLFTARHPLPEAARQHQRRRGGIAPHRPCRPVYPPLTTSPDVGASRGDICAPPLPPRGLVGSK